MEPTYLAAGLCVLLGLGVLLAVRLVLGLRWDRQGWTRVDRLGTRLDRRTDEPAILRAAIAGSARTLRCEAVLAVLDARPDADGFVATTSGTAADDVLVRQLPPGQEVPAAPAGSLVVPMHASGERIGELRVLGGSRSERPARRRLATGIALFAASSIGAARAGETTRQRMQRDHLTGLGTRALLDEVGSDLLAGSADSDQRAAVLLLDLDGFKPVNDAFGHAAGDRLLVEVARRIADNVRTGDLAFRLGGDEFVVLMLGLSGAEEAEASAGRLLAALPEPVPIEDAEVQVHASAGIAVLGEDGSSLVELLAAADQAMYLAKSQGPGRWRRPTGSPAHDERGLAATLREGVQADQLVVHYQPQIRARDGHVVGFEALLRWQHPEQGLLGPAEFLPTVERCGRMNQLTAMVLDRALGDLVRLRAQVPDATMSVNVSIRNLLDRGFADAVSASLRRHGLGPAVLVLEITEPAPGPATSVESALAGLRELGVVVSIHEFGAGQSSMTALSRFPAIREVKIHPSLVDRVVDEVAVGRLIRAIVQSARALGVRVVGEGVESAAVALRLEVLGCERLQGFQVHPPALPDALADWLERSDNGESRVGPSPDSLSAP